VSYMIQGRLTHLRPRAAMRAPVPYSPSVPIGVGSWWLGALAADVLATCIGCRENARLVAMRTNDGAARPRRRGPSALRRTPELDQEEATARTYAKAILELEPCLARR
jgi:hypothetical protein